MGRPRLPKGEAKTETIRARVTKSELEAIQKASKDAGRDVSDWARQVLMQASELGGRQ